MGLHPETEGYYTAENQGFEYVNKLPELPKWLLNAIISKNARWVDQLLKLPESSSQFCS